MIELTQGDSNQLKLEFNNLATLDNSHPLKASGFLTSGYFFSGAIWNDTQTAILPVSAFEVISQTRANLVVGSTTLSGLDIQNLSRFSITVRFSSSPQQHYTLLKETILIHPYCP